LYSIFQLLRMSTEAAKITGWECLEKAIPRLRDRDASAGDLDIEARLHGVRHPRWTGGPLQASSSQSMGLVDPDQVQGQGTPSTAASNSGDVTALLNLPRQP
jgi:hypothetical protein